MIPVEISRELNKVLPISRVWTHVDWLSLTFPCDENHRVRSILEKFFPLLKVQWFEFRAKGFWRYAWGNEALGIRLDSSPQNHAFNSGLSSLSLSGKFWECLNLDKRIYLIHLLGLVPRCRASRLDIAKNHFYKAPLPYQESLYEGLEKGEFCIAGAKNWSFIKSESSGIRGSTLSIGSRQSEAYQRIYDARAKHCPEIKFLSDWHWSRQEMELKGSLAHRLFHSLSQIRDGFLEGIKAYRQRFASSIYGFFCRHEVQISDSGSLSRHRTPAPVWKEMGNFSWLFRIRAFRPAPSRQQSMNWLSFGGAGVRLLALSLEKGAAAVQNFLDSIQSWIESEPPHKQKRLDELRLKFAV